MHTPLANSDETLTAWIKDYTPPAAGFDELRDPAGKIRPQWAQFLANLKEMGQSEYARRWEIAARLNRENDVIYNASENEGGLKQPWAVEAIPHLIMPSYWARIQAALSQRARLLNRMLNDIYGQQRLLREGVLPAEIIFSHPGFLRPLHGLRVPQGIFLHLYAADLAKGKDGDWFVLADRTQAPSGAGYALENRIVVSRTYPEIFHDFQVHRLTGFFNQLRDTLGSLARHNRDNPRIVVLSPGPLSETYFEHVYLARYLGYPVVEGADLTTRDNCVYLKTLGGLQLVDVVLRQVNDTMCDPLELRYDSLVGVPGLVQAAHAGNVTVVNSLGSGMLGSYAFMEFLPDVARFFDDEELKLPSLPTWWCGRPDSLEYVLANVDKLVVKAAFPNTRIPPRFGGELSKAEREKLIAEIKATPSLFIGQETMELSSTPTWSNGRVEPRRMLLRAYSVAKGDDYEIMPGGLTRVAGSVDSRFVAPKRGGSSKDTWVLSEGTISAATMGQASVRILTLSRNSANQHPSRVADNIYWVGRYVERVDSIVRLLRAVVARVASDFGQGSTPELPTLIEMLTKLELIPAVAANLADQEYDEWLEKELGAALHDGSRSGSIRGWLDSLRRTSWFVRDRLSTDSWRILHRLENEIPTVEEGAVLPLSDAFNCLNQMVITIAGFSGLAMDSMTRGHTWRFLDIGRRVERSINMIDLLKATLVHQHNDEPAILQSVLEIADSSMTYRYRYLATLQIDAVLDLLLTDETNPRSLAYQLAQLNDHVEALPRDTPNAPRSQEQRLMLGMLSRLRLVEIPELTAVDEEKNRPALEELLSTLLEDLPALSDSLSRTYFSHTEAVRQLGNEPQT